MDNQVKPRWERKTGVRLGQGVPGWEATGGGEEGDTGEERAVRVMRRCARMVGGWGRRGR